MKRLKRLLLIALGIGTAFATAMSEIRRVNPSIISAKLEFRKARFHGYE